MTPNDVRAEIDRLTLTLLEKALAVDSNRAVRLGGGGREWVTWASPQDQEPPLYASASVEEYVRLLRHRQYSVLLRDFAMLQLWLEFERGAPSKHRFCFFPCPVIVDDAVEELGIADYIDALTTEELMRRTVLDGPIRLDFDRSAAGVGHPAAHLTIARNCCRVPLFGPLSIGHFVRFIFSNFYPDWWGEFKYLRDWPLDWFTRTVTEQERQVLHVECRQPLVEKLFGGLHSKRR